MKTKLTKAQVITICESLGFRLDLDRFKEANGWIRFQLPDHLDERDLRLIWYKHRDQEHNLKAASQILFKAGQKAYKLKLNEYVSL